MKKIILILGLCCFFSFNIKATTNPAACKMDCNKYFNRCNISCEQFKDSTSYRQCREKCKQDSEVCIRSCE